MTTQERGSRPLLTDGGRPTPGVPDVDDEPDQADQKPEESTASKRGSAGQKAASGRQMPGVPQTEGAETESPDEHEGGGSCGTGGEADHETVHDLTTAITLEALKRTESPSAVIAETNTWSDWVGVVGDASGPAMNTYFRNNGIDVDFFNDVSRGPADRLARIDETHHFYSERRVLVGLPEEREWAEEAGWEFQSFHEVAEEADWSLTEE
ncbi:Uncharacterized protein HSRCO_2669 [Halanaeroarchaeum sp. HSR-CO]|uniref:DUF7124 domain-containing protein n=1 Tax=Halanaeroarchaeum sp. HSR-CO TaxID=2866382 RepID=UPI00217E34C5|nr:hypothetical protein [Halanaeroarchaeum sp. HSR-CO]UWG48929.1 Uncharacterized protein HSRCO_2669 [Halanaeroarchaeum sp. HSR-CO]